MVSHPGNPNRRFHTPSIQACPECLTSGDVYLLPLLPPLYTSTVDYCARGHRLTTLATIEEESNEGNDHGNENIRFIMSRRRDVPTNTASDPKSAIIHAKSFTWNARVVEDAGTEANFIHPRLVERCDLKIHATSPIYGDVQTGYVFVATRKVQIKWTGKHGAGGKDWFYIAPIDAPMDLLVGKRFLSRNHDVFLSTDMISRAVMANGENTDSAPDTTLSAAPHGIPPTDSGYASMAKSPSVTIEGEGSTWDHSHPEKMGSKVIEPNETGTVYSDESTTYSTLAQRLISDICIDIYRFVSPHVNDDNWPLMSGMIPDLIKSFAVRIGLDSSVEMNNRIMHFVHKYHREIAKQLRKRFPQDDQDATENCRNNKGGMSVLEKMSIWQGKDGDELLDADEIDHFEGVEDFEDVEEPSFASQSKAIIETKAYDWLISSLLKASTFYWDETHGRVMVEDIRSNILGKLPTGIISKTQPPCTYQVAFKLPWLPIEQRLKQEASDQFKGPTTAIAEILVFTCSSMDQIQATTIRQYLDKTWPSGGVELLGVIQGALNRTGGRPTCSSASSPRASAGPHFEAQAVLPDKTEICSRVDELYLTIFVSGPPCSITEVGEQLAWIGAALQPSQPNAIVHSTPLITYQQPTQVFVAYPKYTHSWIVNVRNKIQERADNDQIPGHASVQSHLGCHVVARGYPTSLRPGNTSGIEIPTQVLLKLVPMAKLQCLRGHVVLHGNSFKLRLVEQAKRLFVWHISDSAWTTCHCACSHFDHQPVNAAVTNILDLWEYRHVLGHCVTREGSETEEDYEEAGSISSDSIREASNYMPLSSAIADFSDNSLDSDMLSVSETSETEDFLESALCATDPLYPIISAVVNRIIDSYQNLVKDQPQEDSFTRDEPSDLAAQQRDRSSANGQPTTQGSNHEASSPNAVNVRLPSQKRTHGDGASDEEGEAGDDEPTRRGPKRQQLNEEQFHRKVLACPFWKLDPNKNRGCFGKKLSKISHVKQHLMRKHTPKYYCQRCFNILPSKETLDIHVAESICNRDPSRRLDGITHEQHWELARKSKPNLMESGQWFAIWDIVFPDQPRPSSAYVETDLTEDFCQFREYAQTHGVNYFVEELRASGFLLQSGMPLDDQDMHIHRIVSHGFNTLYDRWLSRRAASSTSETSSNSSFTRSTIDRLSHGTRSLASASSVADSGVAVTVPSASSSSQGHLRPPDSFQAHHRLHNYMDPIESDFPTINPNAAEFYNIQPSEYAATYIVENPQNPDAIPEFSLDDSFNFTYLPGETE